VAVVRVPARSPQRRRGLRWNPRSPAARSGRNVAVSEWLPPCRASVEIDAVPPEVGAQPSALHRRRSSSFPRRQEPPLRSTSTDVPKTTGRQAPQRPADARDPASAPSPPSGRHRRADRDRERHRGEQSSPPPRRRRLPTFNAGGSLQEMEQVDLFTRSPSWSDRVPSPIACRRNSPRPSAPCWTAARAGVPRVPWDVLSRWSRGERLSPADRIPHRARDSRATRVHRARRGLLAERSGRRSWRKLDSTGTTQRHSSQRSRARRRAGLPERRRPRILPLDHSHFFSQTRKDALAEADVLGDRRDALDFPPRLPGRASRRPPGSMQIDADGARDRPQPGGRRRIVGDSRSVPSSSPRPLEAPAGGSWLRGACASRSRRKPPARRSTSGRTRSHPHFRPPRSWDAVARAAGESMVRGGRRELGGDRGQR